MAVVLGYELMGSGLVAAMIAILIGAGAAWMPAIALAVAGGALGLVLLLRRPELLVPVALLIPSAHFMPTLRLPVPPTYFTVAQAAVLLVVAMTVLRRPPALRDHGYFGPAFVVAGLASAVGSTSPVASLYWVINVGIALTGVSLVLAPRVREARRAVHRTIIAAAIILAIVTLLEFTFQRAVLDALYAGQLEGYRPGGAAFRPPSLIGNALVTSAALVIVYAIVLVTPYIRRGRFLIAFVLAAAAVVTLSRTAVIAVVVVTGVYLLRGESRKRRVPVILTATILSGFALQSILPLLQLRSGGRGYFGATAEIRARRADEALQFFREEPLVGVGLGGAKRALGEQLGGGGVSTTDNTYLTLLAELGLVGTALLIVAGVLIFQRRSRSGSLLPWVAVLISAASFDLVFHDATIILIGFLLADTLSPSASEGTSGSAPPLLTSTQIAPVPESMASILR